jgi:hypothetical protein
MKMITFKYEFDDEDGINPTKQPMKFMFDVTCSFSPGEKMVKYLKDGSGYPGSPPEVELIKVELLNTDLTTNQIQEVETWFAKHTDKPIYQNEFQELATNQVESDY